MKRWTSGACALAAVALVAGTAGPATAQYPGANGARIYFSGGDAAQWGPTCVDAPPEAGYLGYTLADGGADFSPDGKRIAAVVSTDYLPPPTTPSTGDATLAVAGLSPCTATHITDVDSGTTLSFSPDGKQLAVTQGGDVHVIDASTGADVRNLTPNFPSTREYDPTWSPKGTIIAYQASDGLRSRPATGGSSTLLVKGTALRADFSPDGTRVAYIDGVGHISYLTLATGVVTRTIIVADSVRWSPDGHYFFFGVSTGLNETCVTATLTGRIVSRQVADDPCSALAWQPLH